MRIHKHLKNPFVLFFPFLILYIILVIIFPTDGMSGDESRYLIYAKYMITGILPQNEASIDILGNGPGYSIVLIPFVLFHLPYICITVFNCILYYLSVVILFKAAIRLISFRKALLIAIFWGLYYNSYENFLLILSETLAVFIISALCYVLIKAFEDSKIYKPNLYIFLSGFLIGSLALTKPIFGYVLSCMFIVLIISIIIKPKNVNYKRAIKILLIAYLTATPYLIYTYNVTGKFFYWSSFGGNNLYWMSTPFNNEYGNWLPDPHPAFDTVGKAYHYNKLEKYLKSTHDEEVFNNYNIYINHENDFKELYKYKGVQKDELFRKFALRNIVNHPLKYIQNCISNIGRITFNYPYSYKYQNPGTLIRLPMSGAIIFLMVICLIPTFRNWYKIFYPIRFMLLFSFFYLGGSVFGSAETRMFTITAPVMLLWISYIIHRTIVLKNLDTIKN